MVSRWVRTEIPSASRSQVFIASIGEGFTRDAPWNGPLPPPQRRGVDQRRAVTAGWKERHLRRGVEHKGEADWDASAPAEFST
jgi:hypothetical protein